MTNAIDKLVPTLTVGGVMSNAWKHTKGSKWAIWLPILVVIVVLSIIESLLLHYKIVTPITRFLLKPIVSSFIVAPFVAGALMTGVIHLRKQSICANTGFQYFSIWIPLGIAAIIVSLINSIIMQAAVSILSTSHQSLFIIATILNFIISTLFMVSPAVIADKKVSALQGLIISVKKTLKNLHKILAILIVNSLILIICVLPLSIGRNLHNQSLEVAGAIIFIGFLIALIWLIPYFTLCIADIYNKITSDT